MPTDNLTERIAEMKAAAEKYQDANLNARNWFEYDAAKENFRQECKPTTVLALIAHVEELERKVAELRDIV